MISPVLGSSLRNTGQLLPSALASVSSSFVPKILKVDFPASIGANSGQVFVYRLLSLVGRSSSILSAENSIFAFDLSIFLR